MNQKHRTLVQKGASEPSSGFPYSRCTAREVRGRRRRRMGCAFGGGSSGEPPLHLPVVALIPTYEAWPPTCAVDAAKPDTPQQCRLPPSAAAARYSQPWVCMAGWSKSVPQLGLSMAVRYQPLGSQKPLHVNPGSILDLLSLVPGQPCHPSCENPNFFPLLGLATKLGFEITKMYLS